MQLIPAIDLRGGRVVRLEQGDYDRETRYTDDPVELALRYQNAGATRLHLVDLDSARAGGEANFETIQAICKALDIPVQTGGGVRCLEDLQQRLEAGAERVVIGSLCVKRPDVICAWLESLGSERIVAGLDVSRGVDGAWFPHASGWSESGDTDLFTLLDRFTSAGLIHLLCTDIERDGMFAGVSTGLYKSIADRFAGLKIQASGGVASAADLQAAAASGASACIVGRALLEGRVPVSEIQQWSR
ncbi:MAG: 1-(5-phosphoribosyl)-5-[(5-phosphoribosylamino)methylideneamino] imidazole-4-carboxamide isomerase [Wenzhouxiangella sp.]|nr:MAG: 1-(5-phosphoribosyl)-5-[(5-phosphoribosylamino)methylideneamino] imidazole-4-carboxamide isomerase [Wenzhouxiangella sp.]